MATTFETRRAGGAAGPLELSCGETDNLQTSPKPAATQGEFRFTQKGAKPLLRPAMTPGLLHSLARLVAFTKHAARAGADVRTLRNEAREASP
jgi:hypothetical protein